MINVDLYNKEKNEVFTKHFRSDYLFNKFKNKLKYSKKLMILSYERTNEDE